LSAVRECLFNVFVATLYIGRLASAHNRTLLQLIWRKFNH